MKKLAIIGASYLQVPLIIKAKQMGIETHVFAWAVNDVGEKIADFFYPISIVEKEQILNKCKELNINGICSIASDLAAITVNYVAYNMGLTCNLPECVIVSTNKYKMRSCFGENGNPSPKFKMIQSIADLMDEDFNYPIIVKPVDRSGSRGITRLDNYKGLEEAIERAKENGFEKSALVEEFVDGYEYSVECISWQGKHHFLSLTKKFTTGAPNFIETAHVEPACVSDELVNEIKKVIFSALDSLKISNGASHSEIKIANDGKITIIEIGGRMGGDLIGSDLVEISTGIDFVKAVIQVAIGQEPDITPKDCSKACAVRFILSKEDINVFNKLMKEHPEYVVRWENKYMSDSEVTDSSSRMGYYLFSADKLEDLEEYLPQED